MLTDNMLKNIIPKIFRRSARPQPIVATNLLIEKYQKAIASEPKNIQSYFELGKIYEEQNKLKNALNLYQLALVWQPDNHFILVKIGKIFAKKSETIAEAINYFQRAITLDPTYTEAYEELGIAYVDWGKAEEAIATLEQAQKQMPQKASILVTLGRAYWRQNKLSAAKLYYEQALALDNTTVTTHLYYAYVLLKQGEYLQGWREFEYRLLSANNQTRAFYLAYPHWQKNEDIRGKILLLYTEQGFGDSIQFVRYATLVAQQGVKVLLHCEAELAVLMQQVTGISQVISKAESSLPYFDLCCSLLSLPWLCETTLATIPATIPYIQVATEKICYWQKKISSAKLKIGLAWAGNPRKGLETLLVYIDVRRSIALKQLDLLKDITGIEFYSLQKGEAAQQKNSSALKLIDHTDELLNFADTAALITQLDLIISVDTSVAHLAAALGKPTWILNRLDACWRWLDGREDSPWYPTVRLFNQTQAYDWSEVLLQIKQALLEFIKAT